MKKKYPQTLAENLEAIQEIMESTKGGDKFGQTLRKKKIPHLSFSQIAAVEFCHQRYYLDYIKAVKLDPIPNYFVKGKLLHQFIASSYMKIADNQKINPAMYLRAITRYYEDHHRVHLENAVQVHLENIWQECEVIGVEEPFVVVIDENLPPLVGVIDLLLKQDDKITIVDHKTGNDFYSPNELQVAIYLYYAQQKFPQYEVKIYYDQYRWVNNLGRIRKPPLLRSEVTLPLDSWHKALVRIRDGYKIMKNIREEDWAVRDGECFRCPFRNECWQQ